MADAMPGTVASLMSRRHLVLAKSIDRFPHAGKANAAAPTIMIFSGHHPYVNRRGKRGLGGRGGRMRYRSQEKRNAGIALKNGGF
jgi:hypothetical protein